MVLRLFLSLCFWVLPHFIRVPQTEKQTWDQETFFSLTRVLQGRRPVAEAADLVSVFSLGQPGILFPKGILYPENQGQSSFAAYAGRPQAAHAGKVGAGAGERDLLISRGTGTILGQIANQIIAP